MDRNIEIGVLIPSYNAEKFISQGLDSVISQSYKPIQIIICDDASQDNTVSIIKEYNRRYPKLIEIICHNKNLGISANLNSGLEKMNTQYVSIMAGDDIWTSDKLLNEVKLLSDEVTCVYSACSFIDEQGNRTGQFKRKYDGDEGDVLFQMLMHEMAFRNPLLKMSIIKKIGFYNEDLEIFEDWQFKIEYLQKSKVAFSPDETVYYRRHSNGISSRSNDRVYYESLKKVYNNVSDIINTLSNDEKGMVLDRKRRDLQRHLYYALKNEDKISFFKKIQYLKELAVLNPKLFLRSIINL